MPDRRLRVAFLAGTLGRGGAERQLAYMVRALLGRGVAVRVLSLTHGEPYEAELRALGIDVEWVGRRRSRPLRAALITRAMRRAPVDIVQSVHFYTNLYAAMAARFIGAREIGAIRGDLSRQFVGHRRVLDLASLRLLRCVAANTEAGRRAAVIHGADPARIVVLPNVIDLARFRPREVAREGPPRLLFLGRFGPEKRPDRFVRLVAALAARSPVVRFEAWLAGDGPLRRELEEQALRCLLPPGLLTFRGAVTDAAALLREVDVVVLTSDTEGAPNVLLEAMASGLPVIATRVGGVAELVPEDAGILVTPEDERALVEATSLLLRDGSLRQRLGRGGLAHVRRTHALDTLADRLLSLYDRVLGERAGSSAHG